MVLFRRNVWIAALLVLLLGLGVSFYLTYDHYLVLQIGISGKSFCNINAYLNCDMVLNSSYSMLGTLPLSGLAFVYYLYLLVILFWVLFAREKIQQTMAIPCFTQVLACLLSVFLFYISYFKIHFFCVFCATLYLVNFLLLIFFFLMPRYQQGEWMNKLMDSFKSSGLIFLVAVFAVGSLLLHIATRTYAADLSDTKVQTYIRGFMKQTPETIDTAGRPSWGNPDAKIVIAEFSDFECPFCKVAAFTLKPMLQEWKDRVKIVFMNYPLDQSCNSGLDHEMHKQSCKVAYYAYCAGKQGKFWEFHDEVFDRQPRFSDSSLENVIKKLGLDQGQMQACVKDEATKNAVAADINEGLKLKLMGTPSIFINGRMMPTWTFKKVMYQTLEAVENAPPPPAPKKDL